MSVSRFLIGEYSTGMENDRESWLLPNEAFPTIIDAYVWRKRVLRRRGN